MANLVANIGIVVTGGAVRLTGSGLGCPTWPRCTDESYVAHGELGLHGAIEFGNRMLTFVLVVIAIAAACSPRFRSRTVGARRGSSGLVIALGIPLQAVIGGITVLTDLNPWIVAGHLLVSMAMIGVCVRAARRAARPGARPPPRRCRAAGVARPRRQAGSCSTSAPSSPALARTPGDPDSPRNGLDPQAMSHVHAARGLRPGRPDPGAAARRPPRRARAGWPRGERPVLVIELLQGVLGWVQYFTRPARGWSALHMLGAALLGGGAGADRARRTTAPDVAADRWRGARRPRAVSRTAAGRAPRRRTAARDRGWTRGRAASG